MGQRTRLSSRSPGGGAHWVDGFDGALLARRRRAAGLSQAQLAARILQERDGAASAVVAARRVRTLVVQLSCYESGRTRPQAPTVRILARALDVDPLELLRDGPLTLARLRARLGLTQQQTAVQLGMSRSGYASIERGTRPVSPLERHRLGRVLQVPLARLDQALPRA